MKSVSSIETEKIARNLASKLKGTETITLFGDLGAGKTTFVRGLASFFGIENEVSSPTFAIMNEYKNNKISIYHFDMYRINSTIEDLETTGFFEYLNKGLVIVEWSENIQNYLPENSIHVRIEKENENDRNITITGVEI